MYKTDHHAVFPRLALHLKLIGSGTYLSSIAGMGIGGWDLQKGQQQKERASHPTYDPIG